MKIKVYESLSGQNQYFSLKELHYRDVAEREEGNIVNIMDDVSYQEILGFGGAFTEASAYNYFLLDENRKKDFLTKYFDRKGVHAG